MTGAHAAGLRRREADSAAASAVKAMQADGRLPKHASGTRSSSPASAPRGRIAFHYLRDGAEADEAVQDAFVKAYSHLASFREELPFEVWFTRILINGCLDRIKARTRRERWLVPMSAERRRATAGSDGFRRSGSPAMALAGGSVLGAGAAAEVARALAQAARTAAFGVHAEPRTKGARRGKSAR